MIDFLRVLDLLLGGLLVIGNLLALPIWWWLLGAPVVRLLKRHHTRGQTVVA